MDRVLANIHGPNVRNRGDGQAVGDGVATAALATVLPVRAEAAGPILSCHVPPTAA